MEKVRAEGARSLTKTDLIWKVAGAAQLSHHEAKLVIESILNAIVKALREGGKVEIRGFGSLRCKYRRARRSRNPLTGTAVAVPEKRVVYFTSSRLLKLLVNGRRGLTL